MKKYDIFIFFNELDLLEMRLNILNDHVDYFVIVEATETFTGSAKKLFFEENKDRFEKFNHKIIHHVIRDMPRDKDDLRQRLLDPALTDTDKKILRDTLDATSIPDGQNQWLREFYQKESMKKPLVHLSDDDICFISDLDEIWNPDIRIDFTSDAIFKFRQHMYAYYLNNRSSEAWEGTYATKYKNIRNNSLNRLDTPSETKYTYLENGGWHFTNMGGAEQIKKKLESYGHQEFNNIFVKMLIKYRIFMNKDFVGRDFKFWIDEKGLPKYILENKSAYKKFFK